MYFTFSGVVVLIVTLYLFFFTRTRTLFYFTFFISAFTSLSMINLPSSRNSILSFYIVGSFFILKVIYELMIKRYTLKKIKFLNGILIFVVYSLISLILPVIYSGKVLVFTPDSPFTYVSFSIQNITQYLYLLFGFIVYLGSYIVFTNEIKVNMKRIIDITTLSVLCLGFIQFIAPHRYFDFLFRTNYSHLVQYLETGLTRISSVTNEPSMLSLFITPIGVYYFISLINKIKSKDKFKFDLAMIILIIITAILNRSSSFYLAIGIVFFIMVIDYFREIFNTKNKNFLVKIYKDKIYPFLINNKGKSIFIALVFLVLFLIAFRIVGYRFLILALKLLGLDDSGSTRMELFSYHMSVFLKHLFTGVGFGTLRSNDLLSMWSAQLGLIGMVPFIYYFISRFRYIFKYRDRENNREIFYLVITTLIILITSVPEPYYIYTWIYIALLEVSYRNKEMTNKAVNKLVQKDIETV